MLPRYCTLLLVLFVIGGPGLPAARAQTEVTLVPSHDNTLYESSDGTISNGAGQYLFAGQTSGGTRRRALLRFDVAAVVPAGARIDSVTLTLHVSRRASGIDLHPARLHRVTAAWGEGASDASGNEGSGTAAATGDATWLHTSFDGTRWSNPGGDFTAEPAASATLGDIGFYTWGPSAAMTADVQAWLDDPGQNHGWIVLGDESAAQTTRRFDSREYPTEAQRPLLRVYYTQATAAEVPASPAGFRLLPAYPNPFREATTIVYEVGEPEHVTLEVFDVLGRRVARLVDGPRAPGRHRATFVAPDRAGGLYVYRLRAGEAVAHGRVARIR